jgi:murein DD-endopeptidase MepM/ murein hydrolase activator NlpD
MGASARQRDTLLARARSSRGIRLMSSVAAAAVLVAGAITVSASPASAAEYPTWSDVQEAKATVTKQAAMIARIKKVIADLANKAAAAQAQAVELGEAAQEADQAYQEQALKTQELSTQADTASATAEASKKQAAQLAARLYRAGNVDMSMNLLVNAGDADETLYNYGMSEKLSQQWQGVYRTAQQDENTAASLKDQAEVAQDILQKYKDAADAAADKARQAADAALAAVEEEQNNKENLEQLLAVAEDKLDTTKDQYDKGVVEREKARQRALAAQQAQRQQVGAADKGKVVDGWTNPAFGPISSNFGYRVNPLGAGTVFHLGTDIAAGCNAPEYAAHDAVVDYAGWNGIYGNFIRLDVGGGITLEYGHIVNGGTLVRTGEKVTAGEQIAKVGSTGGSTGCHLHYGVRINGLVTNPVLFMSARGISLGRG